MVDAISTAVSALNMNAKKIGVAANNIANMGNVGVVEGESGPGPYTPQDVVSIADPLGGVQAHVVDRDPASVTAYDPNSPYANESGQVAVPNVDLATEAITINLASTAYQASLKVIETARDMQKELLDSFDTRV